MKYTPIQTDITDPATVSRWLRLRIADMVGLPAAEISPKTPFVEFGLSSIQAVELVGDLEQWSGRSLPETLAYDFPTIATAARYVATLLPERVS